jgi:hypothetical protein
LPQTNTIKIGTLIDAFLTWVINYKYTSYLKQFLYINTLTIYAFTTQILNSAIRIRNIKFLITLLDHSVKFDSVLYNIFSIGDMEFLEFVLSRVDSTCFEGAIGIELFRRFVKGNYFDLAQVLVHNGVSIDGLLDNETPLYNTVSNKNLSAIKFLLNLSADVNIVLCKHSPDTALGKAALLKNAEIVALLVEHSAEISCIVGEEDLLE